MSFANVNFVAIFIAAIAGFIVSGVWYTFLFARVWMAAQGLTEEAMIQRGPKPLPFVVAFVANLVMALVLAVLLGTIPSPTFVHSIEVALLVWVGFVLTVIVVNHQFADRKPMLTVIDAGNWLAVLIVMGAIIGAFG